ncbi:MAG: cupin domain-containing protein [Acidobacteria bacterium]|nr:cupin domain-containing protein [Acidobacteriota bacterium]
MYSLAGLLAEAGDRYHEFLRVPALSAGIYVLPAGSRDPQTAHDEDEIYFVVRGRAKVKLGKDERDVREGDVIFVEKRSEHRFFDMEEELVLLVVFAPAESGARTVPSSFSLTREGIRQIEANALGKLRDPSR